MIENIDKTRLTKGPLSGVRIRSNTRSKSWSNESLSIRKYKSKVIQTRDKVSLVTRVYYICLIFLFLCVLFILFIYLLLNLVK